MKNKKRRSTRFIVKEKDLSRKNIWGHALGNVVTIDKNLNIEDYISTLIHECLHVLGPFLSEETVEEWGEDLKDVLLDKLEDKKYIKRYE